MRLSLLTTRWPGRTIQTGFQRVQIWLKPDPYRTGIGSRRLFRRITMNVAGCFGSGRLALSALVVGFALQPVMGAAQTPSATPTFTKDIAPILQRSCVTCHRPGEMAPMSLMTYEDARPWARAIKTRTASREMPPFHIDKTIGIQQFKNDPSLSDQEIAMVVKWADGGAPRGNPADMPPARQFGDTAQWQIGKPDLVIKYPAFPVPAAGPDLFG